MIKVKSFCSISYNHKVFIKYYAQAINKRYIVRVTKNVTSDVC